MNFATIAIASLLTIAIFFILSGLMGMLRYHNFIIKTQALCLINVIGHSLLFLACAFLGQFSFNILKLMIILVLNIISYLLIIHLLLKKYNIEQNLPTNRTEYNGY